MNEWSIGDVIIPWYERNRRNLPWRNTDDPYLIWISEVILQQTRVVQGLDYFIRFVERFPNVVSLAEAEEDEVMTYWQGLGYYSRARNLHRAAREVVSLYGGEFPRSYKEVLSLKGIGEYTAAAICSFAYRLPYAAIDGNVYRVLSRLFDIDIPIDSGRGRTYFAELSRRLLDRFRPDLYNQAMMEFGALQCIPKSPDCEHCPLNTRCMARAKGKVEQLPVKVGKVQVKPRYFNYLHVHDETRFLLKKREDKDIWRNLYEFPLIESDKPLTFQELQQTEEWNQLLDGADRPEIRRVFEPPKHVLSHRVVYAVFYEIKVGRFSPAMTKFMQVSKEGSGDYAFSRLMQLYWETGR